MRLTEQQVGLKMAVLPERFADRLSEKDLYLPTSNRNAGEWEEALINLVVALHRNQTTITAREDRSLREFLETFRPIMAGTEFGTQRLESMTRWLDELKVVPSLTEPQMIDRLRTIPQRFADRIPPAEIESLTVRPDEEEPGVWFEVAYDLIRTLQRHRTPISSQERTELSMILDALDLPRQELSRLPAT
jgi:hypothetical protein